MNELPFYIEELSQDLNSYELKMFRIQHDETQLTMYLCKLAKQHQEQSINKTFLVNFIIPYLNEARKYIAIKDLYIFAINNPKLINYYKSRLGFHEIKNVEDKSFFEYAKPEYDDYCKFLFFPL